MDDMRNATPVVVVVNPVIMFMFKKKEL